VTLPTYLVKRVPKQKHIRRLRELIQDNALHTVCESAKCPNIGECFSKNTLTFMILGDCCTRNCRFCGVNKGVPQAPDPDEPQRIVDTVKKLNLDYVVITSVTRDDLPDGGAGHFAKVIHKLKTSGTETRRYGSVRSPYRTIKIEVLIPDLQGDWNALAKIIEAGPDVLNHNVETVPRLYSQIRPQADYQRSLKVIKQAKQLKNDIATKSGFMVGLGESRDEIFQVVNDLKNAGCDIVTIGQYLAPSKAQAQVARYVAPEEFEEFKSYGEKLGLKVAAGPFVRSSYRAKEII